MESLVALAILVTISSLFLTAIDQGRQQEAEELIQQEVLHLAKMAVQTKQDTLSLNGMTVVIERSQDSIRVMHEGREVLYVEKD